MSVQEHVFQPRLVDELFDRTSDEVTWTSAGVVHPEELRRPRNGLPTNTMLVMDRMSGHPDYIEPIPGDPTAPYGRFRGRHVIGTGTRVLGGVYLGHRPREALTIDDGPVLRALTQEFVERRWSCVRTRYVRSEIDFVCTDENMRRAFIDGFHEPLFHFVRERIPYDEEKTAQVFRDAKISLDEELSLDAYILARSGVCRQQVGTLLGVFEILEKLCLTIGKMLMCRCYIPNMFSHAWARYEREENPVYILDPAQNFCGLLDHGGEMGKFVYDHEFAKILSAA